MKILTHSFKVTVFENGRFCWNNARWEEKPYKDLIHDLKWSAAANIVLMVALLSAV